MTYIIRSKDRKAAETVLACFGGECGDFEITEE